MPAAAQQRLFVSSVSTLSAARSKADREGKSSCWFFMPLSSDVQLRVGPSAAGGR